ncbi:MAG: penicillin-binding transpeptidase domain-containing protein [Acutalibacteraceae bacterium]|nr:penicillin-binding transpeptidase domain-containing protein [Acutalibacteraceae bacterium]
MPFKKKKQYQLSVFAVLLVIAILLYSVRIYSLQVANAEKYTDKNNGAASVRTAILKAPRGEILDCYGRQIAINRDGYNVVFNKAYVKDNLNDVILTLVKLFESAGAEWKDELPMESTAPYGFKEGESTDKLISKFELAHYATAENCFNAMVEKYKLEDYSSDEQRRIMGVRYSMDIADFSISYPYTFAEDISTELMRKISESGFLLSGVSVEVVPFREYTDTSLAVNLIGSVGPIFAEDWEEYKAKGYSYNDKVGKSGIEKWGEEYLRGTDGEITYFIDTAGKIISSEVTKEPIAGKTIMLTLDKKIQRSAQDSIEKTVKGLQSKGGTATAGAAVAVHIDSGKVICAANYPTYDSATIGEKYDSLVNDPYKPLTDRAFQGVYPIGSTIKPIVAVAALENGVYNQGETIRCVHKYTLFKDYQPSCMGTHGSISLNYALAKSCNYFFFELGRRLGATKLTDYYKQFGLGIATGVEVNDAKGILLEPKSDGGGDTLQIAIGQLNAFTPLQLANYAATLANGGTHYKAGLIDKIVSYDISTVYSEVKPEVKNTVSISDSTIAAVKEGMLSVTEDGTGRAALGDYPIKVGGKTGTAQVTGKADHSVFIAFAPFDNPEIAISVVLEHGSSGFSAGSIVRDILDAYFFSDYNATADTVPFTVLD